MRLSTGPLAVDVATGEVGPLPVGARSRPSDRRVPPARFERAGVAWRGHRALLAWLHDTVKDGLGWLSRLLGHLDGSPVPEIERLGRTTVALLCADAPATVEIDPLVDLLGQGPGATPSGDDLLVGLLLTLARLSTPGARRRTLAIGQRLLEHAETRTGRLSAAHLAQAAKGRAAAPTAAALASLLTAPVSTPTVPDPVKTLLDRGHTSGVDLLAGVLTATLVVCPRLAVADTAWSAESSR